MNEFVPIRNKEIIANEITLEDKVCLQNKLLTNHGNMDFNETATYIYSLIDGKNDVESMINYFSIKYSLPLEDSKNDVTNFLKLLWETGVIYWKDGRKPFLDKIKIDDVIIKFHDIKEINDFINLEPSDQALEFTYAYDPDNKIILDSYKLSLGLVNDNLFVCSILDNEQIIAKLIVMVKAQELEFSIRYLKIYQYEKIQSFFLTKSNEILKAFEEMLIDKGIYIPRNYKYLTLLTVAQQKNELNELFNNVFTKKVDLKKETIDGDCIGYYKIENIF